MTDKVILLKEIKEHLNNTTEVLNEAKAVILRLEEENKELKEVHESDKRSLCLIAEKGVKLEKENTELKAQIEKMKYALLELRSDSYDSGMYLRVDELIQKLEIK